MRSSWKCFIRLLEVFCSFIVLLFPPSGSVFSKFPQVSFSNKTFQCTIPIAIGTWKCFLGAYPICKAPGSIFKIMEAVDSSTLYTLCTRLPHLSHPHLPPYAFYATYKPHPRGISSNQFFFSFTVRENLELTVIYK